MNERILKKLTDFTPSYRLESLTKTQKVFEDTYDGLAFLR